MLVNCRTARATQTLSQHMSQAWQPVPVMGSSTPQGGECEEETIRFGLEVLYIDSWARHRIYTAFKDVLGSGMHYHLQVREHTGRATQHDCFRLALANCLVFRTMSFSVTSLAWALC